MDEEQIRTALEGYGKALSAGELGVVASYWEVPALVLTDELAVPVAAQSEVEEFFGQAIGWYRSQGLVETRAELERVRPLADRLAAVDVRWPAYDESGVEKASERSHYILRRGDDGVWRVQVALTNTASA